MTPTRMLTSFCWNDDSFATRTTPKSSSWQQFVSIRDDKQSSTLLLLLPLLLLLFSLPFLQRRALSIQDRGEGNSLDDKRQPDDDLEKDEFDNEHKVDLDKRQILQAFSMDNDPVARPQTVWQARPLANTPFRRFGARFDLSNLLHLLLMVGMLAGIHPVHAGLNLNFRSKQLSNLWSESRNGNTKTGKQTSSSTTTSNTADTGAADGEKTLDILRLDLSGRVQISVVGPEQETRNGVVIKPLFTHQVDALTPLFIPRRVNLCVDYDFAKSSMGLIRIVPQYIWDLQPSLSTISKQQLPNQLQVAVEKGIAEGVQNAAEARLWWRRRQDRPEMASAQFPFQFSVRCERDGLASVACDIPLHRRVSFQGMLSRNVWGTRTTSLPLPEATTTVQDWWLPDISITAQGAMQARKQFWVAPRVDMGIPRLGFRFAVRRQLEWSLLNSSTDAPPQEAKTILSMQIEGASLQWRSGIRLETFLEEPLAAAQLKLSSHMHLTEGN